MGAILGRSSGPKMGHVMGAKLGAELRKALLGSRKKHNNAPGRLRVNPELNSPGSKLLEGLLVMLADAMRCGDAGISVVPSAWVTVRVSSSGVGAGSADPPPHPASSRAAVARIAAIPYR